MRVVTSHCAFTVLRGAHICRRYELEIMKVFFLLVVLSAAVSLCHGAVPCSIERDYNVTVSEGYSYGVIGVVPATSQRSRCILIGESQDRSVGTIRVFAVDYSVGKLLWTLTVGTNEYVDGNGGQPPLITDSDDVLLGTLQYNGSIGTCAIVRSVQASSGNVSWTRQLGCTSRPASIPLLLIPAREGRGQVVIAVRPSGLTWLVMTTEGNILSEYIPPLAITWYVAVTIDAGRHGQFVLPAEDGDDNVYVFHVTPAGVMSLLWRAPFNPLVPLRGDLSDPIVNCSIGSTHYQGLDAATGKPVWTAEFTGREFLSPAWPTGAPPLPQQAAKYGIIASSDEQTRRTILVGAATTQTSVSRSISFAIALFNDRTHRIDAVSFLVEDTAPNQANIDLSRWTSRSTEYRQSNATCSAGFYFQVMTDGVRPIIMLQLAGIGHLFDANTLTSLNNITMIQPTDCSVYTQIVAADGSYIQLPSMQNWIAGTKPPQTQGQQQTKLE